MSFLYLIDHFSPSKLTKIQFESPKFAQFFNTKILATLIPLGQVLIPTGKEVCCCTNRNQNGNPGTGMFGNSGASGYGSNMGSGMNSGMGSNMGNYGGCCQTSGDDYGSSMYGQYGTGGGQPYGNGFMPNNGYMGGGGQGILNIVGIVIFDRLIRK